MVNPGDFKILLVDDNLDFLEILSTKLKSQGFTNLEQTNNGRQALDLLKENKYDLVILDVMMPEMDGIDVALELMKDTGKQNIKFIFLTAFGEDLAQAGRYIDENIAKQIGAVKFFRKQDPLDNLIHIIKDIFVVEK